MGVANVVIRSFLRLNIPLFSVQGSGRIPLPNDTTENLLDHHLIFRIASHVGGWAPKSQIDPVIHTFYVALNMHHANFRVAVRSRIFTIRESEIAMGNPHQWGVSGKIMKNREISFAMFDCGRVPLGSCLGDGKWMKMATFHWNATCE